MADKFALVGVIGPNGILIPQPWNPGDTLKDQDGNLVAIGSAGGFLGDIAAHVATLDAGQVNTTMLNVTYPVGTNLIEIVMTYGIVGNYDYAKASIDVSGDALSGFNTVGTAPADAYNVANISAGVPYQMLGQVPSGGPLQYKGVWLQAFNPGTRNLQIQQRVYGFGSLTYETHLHVIYSG